MENQARLGIDSLEYMKSFTESFFIKNSRQPTAFTHSYGCQQNSADNQILEGILLEIGYTLISAPEEADVVIYNTCAVRENAEDRVFGNIGALKQAKIQNPNMIIGICGCMVQQKHVVEKLEKSYPFVDLIFGSGAMHMLPTLLMDKLEQGGKVVSVTSPTTPIVENLPILRENDFQAYIPIMSGCNNFCSYCVVPYVRGRERSRASAMIIDETRKLVEVGYKEITLLGQNVNSYGQGQEGELSFPQLLESIANIPGKFRLRFMTSHPKDCTKELIDTISNNPKICSHIHLPVQSGSDRILEEMNRSYTGKEYIQLVEYAKEAIPDISFTSDIIVGFPSEIREDFQKTLDLVAKVGYSALFTFIYSPRQGTKAEKMDDFVLREEKTGWMSELLELQRKKANEFNEKLVGRTLEVLVEGYSQSKEGYQTGRSDGNTIVIFKAEKDFTGKFVDVKINEFMNWAVEGQVL